MKWRRGARSKNIRDVRRRGASGGLGIPGGGAGLGGLGGLLLLFTVLFGRGLLGGEGGGFEIPLPQGRFELPDAGAESAPAPDPGGRQKQFVAFVLDDIQDGWDGAFARAGESYRPATLVLYTQRTVSDCGSATSAAGPFYCPLDQEVHLDFEFFQDLHDRFGAPGDFAQAYVIAHEIGHHVQNLLGISDDVHRAQRQNPDAANELSIRLELQADCLAGVWGFRARREGLLEPGDVREGLDAAAAVGDDRIQASGGEDIDPETWTHGSAEQRVAWFSRGFESGELGDCDTFSVDL